MFLSFLPPFGMRQPQAPYLWVLYKQVTHLNPEEIAFICTADYFVDPLSFEATQRWDISTHSQEYAAFAIPTAEQLSRYRRAHLPDSLAADWLHSGASRTDIMRRMLCTRLPELETHLRAAIRELSDNNKIDAILSWCNVPSLTAVAAEFDLPAIHNELGALRAPCYRWTAYFDFRGVNGNTDAAERYAQFGLAARQEQLPPLGKQEILDLLLIDPEEARRPVNVESALGLALQVEDDTNIVAFAEGWENQRLLQEAKEAFPSPEIRIRHHPGGLQRYAPHRCAIDDSASSIEFIRRCQCIATINSSIGLEALLFDRDVRILGDSPFAIAATGRSLARERNTDAKTGLERDQELLALNFLVFSYLIPYEFLFEPAYLRWRLAQPGELAIYQFHLAYWRTRLQLHNDGPHLRLPETASTSLLQRGLINFTQLQVLSQQSLALKHHRLTEQYGHLEADNRALTEQYRHLEAYSRAMRHSWSWRLTAPLRYLGFRSRIGSVYGKKATSGTAD